MRYSQSVEAKQYAKAFLRTYQSELTLDAVLLIEKAVLRMKDDRHLLSMLQVILHGSFHEKPIQLWCSHFQLPDSVYRLIRLLYKRTKLFLLVNVMQDICCLYFLEHGIVEVAVTSATALTDDQKKSFEQFFSAQSGKQVLSQYYVDPALIAGVRMQADCYLWEYSIADRIKTVHQKLLSEGYYEYKRS